jgi:hypothetical protein
VARVLTLANTCVLAHTGYRIRHDLLFPLLAVESRPWTKSVSSQAADTHPTSNTDGCAAEIHGYRSWPATCQGFCVAKPDLIHRRRPSRFFER